MAELIVALDVPSRADAVAAVERLGKQVYLTEGNRENIKITTPVDLAIAEAILRQRGQMA